MPVGYDTGDMCKSLRVLIVGRNVGLGAAGRTLGTAPRLPAEMKAIDIISQRSITPSWLLFQQPQPKFTKLECFRCLAPLDEEQIARITSHTKRLIALEISGYNYSSGELTDGLSSAKTVRLAGMSEFAWPNSQSYRSSHTGQPFLDWLDQFPSLESVSAYPIAFHNSDDIILSLVEKGIKVIYENTLYGVMFDKVTELAQEKGIQLIHTGNSYRPPIFPWLGTITHYQPLPMPWLIAPQWPSRTIWGEPT